MIRRLPKRWLVVVLVGLLIGLPGAPAGYAQAPVAGEEPPPTPLSAQQLEELVGRIALYPDDLVAIILPASTYPLDVVQADRFLQKAKQDKNLKPDQRWDESIRNLLNYPEVISMMSQDLEWTQDLGEAVVDQQADVLKAIQAFRAKASSAGNLKSDDKQIVVQDKGAIQIVPADPEVIYVPQYQPATVVVQQAAPPPPVYYPMPYPSYYYPYPAGYAFAGFATGVFVGAATAWACNWGGGSVENNVNINNTSNLSTTRNNTQTQQKVDQARQQGQQRADQARAQGGGQAGQAGRGQGQGAGQGGGQKWQSQKRPGEVSQGRTSPRTAEARPGYGGSGGASGGDAFGSGGRGSDATRDASRGAQSRGESASTMERGGAQSGGGSRGGASASTMDKGGSRGGGGSASMGSGSRGGGGTSGGGGGGSRGGGGGGSRGGGRR